VTSQSPLSPNGTHPLAVQPTSHCINNAAACRSFTPPPLLLCLPATSFTTCVRQLRGKRLHPAALRTTPPSFLSSPLPPHFSRRYFPATFEADGCFTHATHVTSRLLETANHFYQDVPGPWVCLQISRAALRKAGIFVSHCIIIVNDVVAHSTGILTLRLQVRDEEALPVGDKAAR
jgi:hypothetical protein